MGTVVHKTDPIAQGSVNTPEYNSQDWMINPTCIPSFQHICHNVPGKYWKRDLVANVVEEMSQSEKDVVDNTPAELAKIKAEKCTSIDLKSQQLLGQGFTYQDKIFSLSVTGQMNQAGLRLGIDVGETDDPDFPMTYTNIDNTDYIQINNKLEAQDMFSAAYDRTMTVLRGGADLKRDVVNAATAADVNAITDNRT